MESHNDAPQAITHLGPIFQAIETHLGQCKHRVHVVVIGATVSNEDVERKYPYQHHTVAAKFNTQLKTSLKAFPYAKFLDPYQLTLQSLERSSDGFHFLSDYNFIYATTILNIMNLFAI